MTSSTGFALHFAGRDAFARDEAVTRALAATPAHDHAQRARLHAARAAACVVTAPALAIVEAENSAEEAARAGDDVSRAWSMIAACVTDVSPSTTARRADLTAQVLRIAATEGRPELAPTAYFLHLGALAEQGDLGALDLALSPAGTVLPDLPFLAEGRHAGWFRCLRATIDGDAERAESLAHAAHAVATEAEDPDAEAVLVAQLAIIRWMQGRVVELEPAFLRARQAVPHEPVWAASLAWMWLKQGRRSAAQALLGTLPAPSDLPVDRNWLATLCILAEVVTELGEEDLAHELRAVLAPHAGRTVTIGLGVTLWGTVCHALGLLAGLLDDASTAIAHMRSAVATTARLGAHPWLAQAQYALAAMLVERGDPQDAAEAVSLAAEATATGRALHLHGIEGAATTVLSAALPSTARRTDAAGVDVPTGTAPRSTVRAGAVPAGATPTAALGAGGRAVVAPPTGGGTERSTTAVRKGTEPPAAVDGRPRIRVLGGFEVVSADGTVARWQSRKARQLVKILVARRGVAVGRETVMDLMWPGEDPARLSNRFSVAAATVRRALDPTGALPYDAYVETRGAVVRLAVEDVAVDVEELLLLAGRALTGPPTSGLARVQRLTEALDAYAGEPLVDEPDELWAEELRREVHLAFFAVAHALAEEDVHDLTRVEVYRRVLALDAYDRRAHEGLVVALERLGARGPARDAREEYRGRMAELAIPV